ncbi:hypothetical protein [Streptomyces sp. NPDC046197]|uniref:hypothetical protein n=1 Tax=Streptomyces sp. NPDC046197 TaxID=3154337 RepID=UPI0033D4E874
MHSLLHQPPGHPEPSPDGGKPQSCTKAPLEAGSAGPQPSAVALSADGGEATTVANGVIHVSAIGPAGANLAPTTELRGNTQVSQDTVAFLDAGNRLVSGAGSRVAEWDLRQVGSIGSRRDVRVPMTCNACMENPVAVSPDGAGAALVSSRGTGIRLYPLAARTGSGTDATGSEVVPGTTICAAHAPDGCTST